jgi:hypothetical protein
MVKHDGPSEGGGLQGHIEEDRLIDFKETGHLLEEFSERSVRLRAAVFPSRSKS